MGKERENKMYCKRESKDSMANKTLTRLKGSSILKA